MAYSSSSSDSEVSNDSTCSKSCLETVEVLKSQYEQLLRRFEKSELMVVPYKTDNCKKGLGYNAVPPPLTRNFMPPKPDLSFAGLEEFTNEPVVIKPVVKNSKAKDSEAKPKAVRKNNGAPIIEDWVSDSEEENVSQTKIEKKIATPSFVKIDFRVNTVKDKNVNAARPKAVVNVARPKAVVNAIKGNNVNAGNPQMDLQDKGVIDSGCSRHMTGNMSYLTDYEEIDGGYVAFGGNPKGGKITGKGNLCKGLPSKLFEMIKPVLLVKRESSTEPLAEVVNTACYVQNRVLVVKPHNKTPYELFHGRTLTLSFMRPFGCHVTILNTIDHLGKFDGNADEGFFVGYSLNSKAYRVFNSRTRIVEENLHIRFSESTPNVAGSGPDWLFDIDALTRTMNYEPIVASTQSNVL
ncbi:retrovirus-related pol polyprotein from transposon TNT 1-94 [Tanacetum coccineum]|uniref:Retrovirus-related pol polyprotein from transposon TNT 1-94 n=1 Tax=Tanacetum coccineum TaxID=301880 RepID=A0ABQ5EBV4_9ASTR